MHEAFLRMIVDIVDTVLRAAASLGGAIVRGLDGAIRHFSKGNGKGPDDG